MEDTGKDALKWSPQERAVEGWTKVDGGSRELAAERGALLQGSRNHWQRRLSTTRRSLCHISAETKYRAPDREVSDAVEGRFWYIRSPWVSKELPGEYHLSGTDWLELWLLLSQRTGRISKYQVAFQALYKVCQRAQRGPSTIWLDSRQSLTSSTCTRTRPNRRPCRVPRYLMCYIRGSNLPRDSAFGYQKNRKPSNLARREPITVRLAPAKIKKLAFSKTPPPENRRRFHCKVKSTGQNRTRESEILTVEVSSEYRCHNLPSHGITVKLGYTNSIYRWWFVLLQWLRSPLKLGREQKQVCKGLFWTFGSH